jgi:hypothetical protein
VRLAMLQNAPLVVSATTSQSTHYAIWNNAIIQMRINPYSLTKQHTLVITADTKKNATLKGKQLLDSKFNTQNRDGM